MLPIYIRACPERRVFVEDLVERLPTAVVVWDATRNALDTFLAACRAAGDGPAIHMEDDVIPARAFVAKAGAVIAAQPGMAVQFFSMRARDLTIGSRLEPGRTFLMGQCFHLPAGYSRDLAAYAPTWARRSEHPTGLDLMVADFLASRRERYWLHVPSLVQHRACTSLIDPRRSRHRQSPTFEAADA